MPRKEPENAEMILISPEDAELLEVFSLRRTFEDDGSGVLRYVQLIGHPDVLDAASRNQSLSGAVKRVKTKKSGSYSLPRMVAQRMYGRPLESNEVVLQKNEKKGDVRRSNLELTTRAEIASRERESVWSSTGVKYVYEASNGRYYAQIGDNSLGTYSTVAEAQQAVEDFQRMIAGGMTIKEAKMRLLNKSRNTGKVLISE